MGTKLAHEKVVKLRQQMGDLALTLARLQAVSKAGPITSGDLDDGGKLNPAKYPFPSAVHELAEGEDEEETKKATESDEDDIHIYAPVLKANDEEQTVTGVVLEPETTDAQGDIIGAEVIRKAAENFLTKFNKATRLGLMHKNFGKQFDLLQSYVAPSGLVINNKVVKEGSWVLKVKVKDPKIWKLVKEGKLKGFSIGGKARVKKLAEVA